MTEEDWDILLRWNSDPEVLYYSDGNDVTSYTLEEVQGIYRSVSQTGFCFAIEFGGKPIGECWLQEMNLEWILQKYPDLDCRRIDIAIGEKQYWGRGIGTEVTRMLTKFGFLDEDADMLFCCSIADYNMRALKAVQKVGYELLSKRKGEPGARAKYAHYFTLTKEEFVERYQRS
jgi:aminoglycoside 6'-N-acetyltransferase